MASARSTRNNVLAGIFVLVAIALAVGCVITLSNVGDRLTPRSKYTVRFSVSEGADIDAGAAVKVGGQRVGRVLGASLVNNELSGEPEYVDVSIEVDQRIRLFNDADVQLIRPLLGSGSVINIAALTGYARPGELVGPPVRLEPGGVINGRLGAPQFLSAADYAKIQEILARVDRISADAEPKVKAVLADAQEAVSSVRGIARQAEQSWPGWTQKADEILGEAQRASRRFDTIAKSVEDGLAEVRKVVTQANTFMDSLQAAYNDNRKPFDEIVANVRELSEKAKGEGYQRVLEVIDQAKVAMDSAASAAREADRIMVTSRPRLTELVSDASLAAQQLKLATVEIRAAPWRLLYQPSKKELENELLYNSVRQYSQTVAELRAAADALEAVTQRDQAAREKNLPSPIDPAMLDSMRARLREAFDRQQEQEKAFMQRWVK